MTYICVSKLNIIGSDDDSSPGQRQAIMWTNAGIPLIWPFGTNFSEMLIEIHMFSFKKMHLKMSAKWRPFRLGLNVLMCQQRNLFVTLFPDFIWCQTKPYDLDIVVADEWIRPVFKRDNYTMVHWYYLPDRWVISMRSSQSTQEARQNGHHFPGWETKNFWYSPELGSLLYSLYKIPLAQACFPPTQPNFHSHWGADER